MKLVGFGCSFTYGSELPSQEHAWANLLASKLNMNICNNSSMIHNPTKSSDFVIIKGLISIKLASFSNIIL